MNRHTKLSVRHLKYIEGIAAGLNEYQAALRASFSESYAQKAGHKLGQHPDIRAELERLRAKVREQTEYTLATAMKEAEEAITFAKLHRNSMAYVKGVELRAKLSGLLIDRIQVATVDIKSALEEAHRRIRDISPVNPRISSDDSLPNKKQGGGGAGGGGSGNA